MTLRESLDEIPLPPSVINDEWTPEPGQHYRKKLTNTLLPYIYGLWVEAQSVSDIPPKTSLALVGSYSRMEGGPRSDLDLVILHESRELSKEKLTHLTRAIINPLWDSGITTDYSVRTRKECRDIAKRDLPALVGLLDLHHIAGNEDLTASVRSLVINDVRKAAPLRLEELLTDARTRWAHNHEVPFLNEPDLKNARGGLRDLNLLRVLAGAWLADLPHDRAHNASAMICDVRDALHVVTRRRSSKLIRYHHAAVARAMGWDGENAEAELMRLVAKAGNEVIRITDQVIQSAQSSRLAWGPGKWKRQTTRFRSPRHEPVHGITERISPSIAVSDSRLTFTHPNSASDPEEILRLAIASARNSLLPSPATFQDITDWVHSNNAQPYWKPECRNLFLTYLASGHTLIDTWSILSDTDLIIRWIPEWEGVRSRPQHAEFHQWTVDRHCVCTIAALDDMLSGVSDWSPPFDTKILNKPVLLLSALLHDIGKQPPGGGPGHPAEGAEMVPIILTRLGFSHLITRVGELVSYHLLLAQLAVSADPDDPATAHAIIDALNGDKKQVAALIALTRADSIGAGERAWTPWRASLIETLSQRCWAVLEEKTPSA